MSALNFDATQHDPNVGFEAIPAGDYPALISDSEVRPTAAGTGVGLNLTWEIIDGPFKGRRIWQWLNIQHTNTQAEEIAQKQLSNVCHAVGVLQVQDSAELHDKPCLIKVKFKPAGPDKNGVYRDASNQVSSCEALNDAGPTPTAPSTPAAAATQAQPAAPAVAAQASAAPPWKR